MKLDSKELLILAHLRKDGRKNLTKISKETRIAVSTIFDKLRKYENTIIKKHTCLLNFSELGYDVRIKMMLKVAIAQREAVLEFIRQHPGINSAYRISNGYDFFIEAVFKDMRELHIFTEKLDTLKIKDRSEYFVLEEIKTESFLADPKVVLAIKQG